MTNIRIWIRTPLSVSQKICWFSSINRSPLRGLTHLATKLWCPPPNRKHYYDTWGTRTCCPVLYKTSTFHHCPPLPTIGPASSKHWRTPRQHGGFACGPLWGIAGGPRRHARCQRWVRCCGWRWLEVWFLATERIIAPSGEEPCLVSGLSGLSHMYVYIMYTCICS